MTVQSYTTPGSYSFTIPTGVSTINVVITSGGGGGTGGGKGGKQVFDLAVAVGDVISGMVGGGGASGANAAGGIGEGTGGNGKTGTNGAAGGGSSSLKKNGTLVAEPGAGGGAGNNTATGGNGGATGNGFVGGGTGGGAPGTTTAAGGNASGSNGGVAAGSNNNSGGGGAGKFGGGGATGINAGGGGGGSGYNSGTGVSNLVGTDGFQAGNGSVTLTYTGPITGTATFSGTGTLAATGKPVMTDPAAFSAEGFLSVVPANIPKLRGSASNHSHTLTTLPLTIPASAQVGDWAIFVAAGVGLTTPTGLTPVIEGGNGDAYHYIKEIQAGDPGSTINFVFSAAVQGVMAAVAVYYDTSGIQPVTEIWQDETFDRSKQTGDQNAAIVPGMWPRDDETVVAAFASKSENSLTPANATVIQPIPGMTIRESGGDGNGLVFPHGFFIADGPQWREPYATSELGTYVKHTTVMYVLCPSTRQPISPRAAITGKPVYFYGESYLINVDGFAYADAYRWYPERLKSYLSCDAVNSKNFGVGGLWAVTCANFAYGNFNLDTGAQTGRPGWVNQAATWSAQSKTGAIIIGELAGDDWLHPGNPMPTKAKLGAEHSVDSLIRLWRSSAIQEAVSNATISYTAGWSSGGSGSTSHLSGGNKMTCSTPGETATITTTKPDIDLILLGWDNDSHGGTGATFSVTVDGKPWATGTTHNQMKVPTSNTLNPFTQMAIPCRRMGPGTHTIVLTHTGNSGDVLDFDCYLEQPKDYDPSTPLIVLNQIVNLDPTSLTTYGVSDSDRQWVNRMVRRVAARFPDGRVLINDPEALGWDPGIMVATHDLIHPTDVGCGFIARTILELLNDPPPAPHIGWGGPA